MRLRLFLKKNPQVLAPSRLDMYSDLTYSDQRNTKEPLITGLCCGKWPIKIRHPMRLRLCFKKILKFFHHPDSTYRETWYIQTKKNTKEPLIVGLFCGKWTIKNMNESCCTHVWMSHVVHMNESCHTYEWVMSHIWMSHVTHMNESRCTHESVMSHIWMSHVTHIDESCHTYEWLRLDIHDMTFCVYSVTYRRVMSTLFFVWSECINLDGFFVVWMCHVTVTWHSDMTQKKKKKNNSFIILLLYINK